MKHFICQPDTHNGFVALTNDILSYFLVDCPHYQELHRKTAGRVRNAERRRHKDDVSNRPLYNPQAVERRTSPKPNPHQAAEHSTEAIVKVQGVLKLPDCLHSPNSCFGVANESICGSKLVVIGTSTGLLALVHAAEPNCVVFAAGRDPAILRRQGPITRLHPLTPPPPPSTTVGTSAGTASPQVVSRAREMGPEVPTTITWMRSGPMVMVGYSRGQVEWYRVTIAQAKLMELRRHSPSQAEYHNAYVAIPASAFVHHINNPRIAKVTALFSHGEGDGFAMQRVGGCRLPDSGSLMSSDYFPACGHVVVGGERGIFVLSASHLDGPLCRLANCPGTFIYCHPMLPMVGVVAHGPGGDVGGSHAEASPVITEAFDFPATPPSSHIGHAPPSLVLLEYREAAPRKVDVIPSPVMESLAAPMTLGESFVVQPRWRAESSLRVLLRTALRDCAPSRHPSSLSFSWKFSTCAEMVIGNMQEGVLEVIRFGRPTSEQSRRAAGDGGEVGTSSILVTEGQPSGSLTVTHTHALRIPFGSVIDVEYVSAATASLCATNRVDPPPEEPGRTSPHRDQVGPTRRRRSTHHRPSGGSSLPGSFYGGSSDRRRGGGPAAPLKEDRLADELLDHAQGGRRRKERGVGFRPLLITSSPPPSPVAQQPTAMSTTMDEDLRGVMASGPGRFSSVVAFSATGEITTVPVEMEAIAAWHEEGSVFVGLGASVCAADIVSIRGLENIMKTRMVKGFGLSASANVTALLAMEEPPADLIALFGLIDVLEKTAIVGSTGPVPAVMTLLEMPLPPNENLMEMQSVPPPLKHALQFPGLQMDVGRLILLHVLDWLPGSHRDEGSRSYLRPTCTMAEVERAVAVEVLHGRYRHGAALLVEHQHLSHAYFSMASLLQRYEDIFASLHQDGADALENFLESRSLWFFIIFLCVCDRSDTAAAPYAYRSRIYACRQLPLWDRVAIAIILESTTEDLLSVLNEYLVDECDRIQTLILLHGISQDTFPYMQQIVDETGDFQLGACLFARIGVLLSSTSRTDATPAVVAATPVTSDGWPLGGAASALAATGSPSTTSSPSGRAVSGFATTDVTTPSPQLKRTLAFVHRNDIPATSLPGHNPTDAPPCANEWLVASGLSNNFIVSNSILAGSQLPPAAAHLDALEERRSPRRGHGETLCHDYAVLGPPTAEVPPSASPRSDSPQVADADGDCGTRASTTCVKTEMEWEENPWTWWAAAYRTFLNKEQVFVRRTLFDVACQRLREQGLSRVAITHSPTSGEVVNWRCLSALTEEGIATQSTRTLVAALSAHRFRCSVCTEVVGTQQRSASHSLAWCSACLHGGHAQHLADWFSGHRKCPVEGCSCRCGEGDL